MATIEGGIPALLKQVRGPRRKQDMAVELDTTPASYGRWERGDFPLPVEHLAWLAEQAGVDLPDVEAMWKLEEASRVFDRKSAENSPEVPNVLSLILDRLAAIEQALGVAAEGAPTPRKAPGPVRKSRKS